MVEAAVTYLNLPVVLPILAIFAASLVALVTLYRGILTLRAEARFRAKFHLHERARRETQAMQQELTAQSLSPAQIEVARRIIEMVAQALSPEDRKRLDVGLHQPSKTGEQRFISHLVGDP
jgi:hypothetical protein